MSRETDNAASVTSDRIAFVVIGRNEGARLKRCLDSLTGQVGRTVYVDSGSSDGSPACARNLGFRVIELDPAQGRFTAARGRNEGATQLAGEIPGLAAVQFIDGDCVLAPGWIDAAAKHLHDHPEIAVLCGRLRERDRDRSMFARLCDLDWDGPAGEIRACGGITLVRLDAFTAVQGFDATLATGEEADLCKRIRDRGGKVVRLAVEMAQHDAGMTTFADWWKRTVRVGYGYAEAAARTGDSKDRGKSRRIASNLVWAGVLPLVLIAGAASTPVEPWLAGLPVLVLLAYTLLLVRIFRSSRRSGRSASDAALYSVFCLLAKWPHLWGHVQFWVGGGQPDTRSAGPRTMTPAMKTGT